jgi:hypothetical protein
MGCVTSRLHFCFFRIWTSVLRHPVYISGCLRTMNLVVERDFGSGPVQTTSSHSATWSWELVISSGVSSCQETDWWNLDAEDLVFIQQIIVPSTRLLKHLDETEEILFQSKWIKSLTCKKIVKGKEWHHACSACYCSVQNIFSSRLLCKKLHSLHVVQLIFTCAKHGLLSQGMSTDWGCLRTWSWGEYIDPSDRKIAKIAKPAGAS